MNAASGPPGTKLKEGECPPIYAEGLFVCGLRDACFERHFDWLLRSDPGFGKDSCGQTIRLYPERCFIMMRDLEDLMKDDE